MNLEKCSVGLGYWYQGGQEGQSRDLSHEKKKSRASPDRMLLQNDIEFATASMWIHPIAF